MILTKGELCRSRRRVHRNRPNEFHRPFTAFRSTFAKTHTADNFGVPASPEKQPSRRTGKNKGRRDEYKRARAGRHLAPTITCLICNENPMIKSNQGIFEEVVRISAYLDKPYCPNKDCVNYGLPLTTHKKLYHEFGEAKSGAKRYRCKACNKTFSTNPPGNPTKRQEKPYKNVQVFRGLVNGMAFNRLREASGPFSVYPLPQDRLYPPAMHGLRGRREKNICPTRRSEGSTSASIGRSTRSTGRAVTTGETPPCGPLRVPTTRRATFSGCTSTTILPRILPRLKRARATTRHGPLSESTQDCGS